MSVYIQARLKSFTATAISLIPRAISVRSELLEFSALSLSLKLSITILSIVVNCLGYVSALCSKCPALGTA